ncbi:MAG: hypothetical protein JKY65_06940 [Planctomycetes bacterium]|nr:hypothetical protein [Planctomycetota bacterium]
MTMQHPTRRLAPWIGGVPLALVGVCGALLSFGSAQDSKPASESAKLFEGRCATCHTVPDTRFATDKAWLGQVLETA